MRSPVPMVPMAWFAGMAISYVVSASAAEIGECGPPAAITSRLKAEDQHSVAMGQLVTEDKRLFGMVFTMSGDRKTGYILKADQPLGDKAGQFCVYNRMADLRLFDARKSGVPPGALLKAPEAEALRRCDQLAAEDKFKRGACGSLNTMLRRIERYGERVVLTGFLTRKDARGQYVPDGTLATVTGRIGGSVNDFADAPARGILGGVMYSSLPEGASVLNAVLVYVEYTPYGLAALP